MFQRLLRVALRNGILKGFLGGSRPWLVIGAVAGGWRLLRKIAGSEPVVVFSQELQPGESLVIAHGRKPV
jgi:hypothetical protein